MVQKDDVLCRLRNEQAASFFRDAFSKMLEHKAAIARLNGVVEGKDPIFDEELKEKAPQLVEDQMRIFVAQQRQQAIELDLLNDQLQQKKQEINEMMGRRDQLRASLKLAQKQSYNFV